MQTKLHLILIACAALLLSSCQLDKQTTGTLDYSLSSVSGTVGYFESRGIYYTRDIRINDNFDFVDQINLQRSTLEISGNILRGDVIRNLQIDVDGVGIFTVGDVYVNQNGWVGVIDSDSDGGFYTFMNNAFRYMSQNGKHDVIVSGNLTKNFFGVSDVPLTISFYNDLNVRIGYR